MELPKTNAGNRYATMMQDLFTKLPLVFAPDQKTLRLAKLIAEKAALPLESLNLYEQIGALMMYVCDLYWIPKLNTTAYHQECNELVKWFNCT